MANRTGNILISQIVSNTGLPEELMTKELSRLVEGAGLETNVVSLEDLRNLLAEYAQEILLSAKFDVEQETLRIG